MNERPTPSDDDLQRLLAHDSSEPPTALDDRIRAAAREAVADVPARRRRRWQIPAGIGVAATLLLTVLVVDRAPEPSPPTNDEVRTPATSSPSRAPVARIAEQHRTRPLRGAEHAFAETTAEAQQNGACENAETTFDASGVRVCVSADRVALSTLPGSECQDSLHLARGPGQVAIAAASDGIEVLVDGRVRWRVRCAKGAWQVEANTANRK